jgi:hypothetical protein
VLRTNSTGVETRGRTGWIILLAGLYFFVETAFFREAFLDRLVFATFGTSLFCLGTAYMLPESRRTPVRVLQSVGVAAIVLALVLRLVQLAS